jgi:hypothetical protein
MFDLEERLLGNDHVHLSNGELIDMMRELGLVLLNYRDMAEAIDIPMRTFIFKKTERQQ